MSFKGLRKTLSYLFFKQFFLKVKKFLDFSFKLHYNNKHKEKGIEKMTEIVLISYLILSFGYVLFVVFSNREKDFYFSLIVLMSTLVVTFNYLGIF